MNYNPDPNEGVMFGRGLESNSIMEVLARLLGKTMTASPKIAMTPEMEQKIAHLQGRDTGWGE